MPDFNPLPQMSTDVHFSFFGGFVFGTPGFPLLDVPLQTVANEFAAGRYKQNCPECFALRTFKKRTGLWKQTRPVAKWWCSSEQ